MNFSTRYYRRVRIAAVLLLMAAVGVCRAEIYRCTDSEGHVIFTQQHCATGQSSEVVNMEGLNDIGSKLKSGAKVCRKIEELAKLIFPHINQTDSILDIYSDLGGRKNLSAGVTAAVNYVFNFHYNPKATKANVVELTFSKCLDGGFGKISEQELPDWDKIKYVREQKKAEKAKARNKAQDREKLTEQCATYREKLIRLRKRLATAKDKGAKLQARVDLEYNEQQLKAKCESDASP